MTRPTRVEINCETGEESIIELTDAEIAAIETAQAESVVRQQEAEAKAAADAEAKSALLEKLGITEDEAKLLLA
jgi:hypothetical protein